MNIKTKFKVGDLAMGIFDKFREKQITLLRIMEIESQTCYAGTQVFYRCRPILLIKEKQLFEDKGFVWLVGHGVGENDRGQVHWLKYREDELKPALKEMIDIVLSEQTIFDLLLI